MAERDELNDPRVGEGYRRLGAEHPPAALDAAILAASRRAVGAGPRRSGITLRRWALPVSVAAVVVLTMSLVVRVQLEKPDFELAAPIPATVPPADDKAASRKVQEKDEVARLAKRNEAAEAQPKMTAGAPPAAVASAPVAGERERSVARQAIPAPAARQAPEAPPAAKAPRFVAEPPARTPAENLTAAPPVPSSAMRPDAGMGSVREEPKGSALAEQGTASAGRAESRLISEDRAIASAESVGKKDESPREWLERIAKLRREGRVKEADESLAEFRRRYPDYEIPKELRDAVLGEAR